MNDRERRQLVTFAVGDRLFAADVGEVERVIRFRQPVPVPRLPDWVAGLVEHSGRSLAVVDLRRRFGLPSAPSEHEPRILVVGGDDLRMGAIVDRVLDVTSFDAERIEPAPALFDALPGGYVQGVAQRDGQPVIVIHAARLLSATERLLLVSASDPDERVVRDA